MTEFKLWTYQFDMRGIIFPMSWIGPPPSLFDIGMNLEGRGFETEETQLIETTTTEFHHTEGEQNDGYLLWSSPLLAEQVFTEKEAAIWFFDCDTVLTHQTLDGCKYYKVWDHEFFLAYFVEVPFENKVLLQLNRDGWEIVDVSIK